MLADGCRWLARRCRDRERGASVTSPRYWLHRLVGSRLEQLADRLDSTE